MLTAVLDRLGEAADDVALELGVRERRSFASGGREARFERRTRAAQQVVDRGLAGVEHLGDPRRAEAEDIAGRLEIRRSLLVAADASTDAAGEPNQRRIKWQRSSSPRTSRSMETDEALRAEALLLGRRSDEWFAERWLSGTGVWADKLNSLPKYVVSSTARAPRWSNGTVLTGDVVDEASRLKQELDGEILVYASYRLISTLLEHDLVDELRLVVFPVVLGAGERLFGETSDKKPMRLVDTKTLGDGLAYLGYERVRDA
ncbi:MAG TPA: dihydrofolate reductase family protein [Thermoleophilaceae bacterium]